MSEGTDPRADARARLDAERLRATDRLDRLRHDFRSVVDASRDTNADDEHDPEGATIAFERSQVDALIRQAEQQLERVASAYARLEDGSYGRCEVCGRPIDPARLEARPTASTCVACAG